MSSGALFILVVAVVAVLGFFVIPRILMKRAIRQVIRIFRQQNAIDVKTAKTVDELKLSPRSLVDGMFKGRDYKPYALEMLKRAEIVRETEDSKLYLSEENLASSRLYKWQ